MTANLEGRTVAVVGASSGIGREVARLCIHQGAQVVVAARRLELLEGLVSEKGSGLAVMCDVADPEAGGTLASAIGETSDHLDALIVSAGSAPLELLRATTTDQWRHTFETNVFGINRVLTALLPLLGPSSVTVVASSETVVAPRSHLGAYGASKAALEHSIEQWREEHPWLRVTTVSLGATMPTEFGNQFDPDTTIEAFNAWTESGRNRTGYMDTREVGQVLVEVTKTLLATPSVGLPRLVLRSPSSVATSDAPYPPLA
jgi:NAD(P)-dependent dehydrogenase (short-subunit alcohol dehydrogenase family)